MPFPTYRLWRALQVAAAVLSWIAAAPMGASELRPHLRVGTSGDYPPFSERLESGSYRGFDVAVAERFAADQGLTLEWVAFAWPRLAADLEGDRFDVAMSGVTVRPERSVKGRFSVPVTESGAVLLVREPLSGVDDPSLRVAVNAGGHLERVARARFPLAQIHAIADNAAVRAALVEGSVDAVVTDTLEAPGWLRGLSGVRQIGPFTRDRKAYWLRAQHADLAARLDAWLLEAEREGVLEALRIEWLGAGPWTRTAAPLEALLAACDERLALMPLVAAWKRSQGRAIVDPEREARVLAAAVAAVDRAAAAAGQPAPPADVVRRFYRAQIDAAVAIQQVALGDSTASGLVAFDLETELRPALIRIGDRMAALLVLASATEALRLDLRDRVTTALARHRLSSERVGAIADAIRALQGPSR